MTTMKAILPGVWKLTLGRPEILTPVKLRQKPPARRGFKGLPPVATCPFSPADFAGAAKARGFQLLMPMEETEQFYGLGLQLLSFNQRGRKKTLRVNSDPRVDLGDSHAPVPFFVSTRGYGVLVDTYRFATFYFGCAVPTRDRAAEAAGAPPSSLSTMFQNLYAERTGQAEGAVATEIPHAKGVTLYIFAGPSMREAVQRYVLFSGGGCLPPPWGLGNWYRCRGDFNQEQVEAFAAAFRQEGIPCDVLGLEPGWQTHSYSCSFAWSDKFPQPAAMLDKLATQNYRANLWTHAFVHGASPLYKAMQPYAGDFEVWKGLVPDLAQPEARRIMGEHFDRTHLAIGASGYKLDECDSSDFINPPWSYPEMTRFPSGFDGEQMHSAMGLLFQDMVDGLYRRRDRRTFGEVRSAHALAAPYPFVLYSDLYDHRDFVRGVVNCGFSGLLWCPEVRHAASADELVRRLQAVVMSPQSLINAWYIKNPPWKQWDTEKNNADSFAENRTEVETLCRDVLRLRMQFLPYLCAAYYRYWTEGLPPFRALVMDYPDDKNVWGVDDEYLMGDRVLVAPVIANSGSRRDVYLPAGAWFDFWTGQRFEGGQKHTFEVPLAQIPIFLKDGALLPLAAPGAYAADSAGRQLTVRVYGDGRLPITLIEDDGVSYGVERGEYNRLTLAWDAAKGAGTAKRTGKLPVPAYAVRAWRLV